MIRHFLAVALLGSTILVAACNQPTEAPAATETAASSIAVTDPWSRETAEGQNAGGAFMTIANTGTVADRLTGGSSPVAGRVEIHTMTMEGDVMKMRQLEDGLDVPAGGEVTLKPGSFHVMLMDLKQPLKAGDTVPLTLTFAGAGTVETQLEVRPAGAMPAMDHAAHGKDKPHG
ncbi:MAG: copper chaperone PCu(A)C [Erythrobacter sp.]